MTRLTVDQVAFWRHNGVVYYVHRSSDEGQDPLFVVNAIGGGRSQRYAVLAKDAAGGEGWQLADDERRSDLMEALFEEAARQSVIQTR